MSAYEIPYDIFNLGYGSKTKLTELIQSIALYCEKEAITNFIPLFGEEIIRTNADITKAQEILNFNPKIEIEEGIRRFVEWYKSFY